MTCRLLRLVRNVRCLAILALASAIIPACTPGRTSRDTAAPASRVVYLDELGVDGVEQEWGTPHVRQSTDGRALTLAGRTYARGLGTHSDCEAIVNLNGCAERFEAVVGVDDETKGKGSVVFVVRVDGREKARTPVLHGGQPPEFLAVDLRGAQQMSFTVETGDDNADWDHGDLVDAWFLLAPGATERPAYALPEKGADPEIAMQRPVKPEIHAPRITGGTPGRPFIFRIPASGQPPLKFTAADLPAGLALDAQTGILSGALQAEGRTEVTITVANEQGEATSTLTIVAGPRALALTPPMGWNSWNVWGTAVDEAKVRAAADAFIAGGLAEYGYSFINIDDAWEGARDANGRIDTNDKFPDMKALADYVHGKGLKLGIYSSPGPKTCAGYEGSYQHEADDARRWAEWGIDLVKYDWCSYGEIARNPGPAEYRAPYSLMRQALDAAGRDIVYSLCQYGMGKVWTWGEEVGGNYWRTTGDITDTWLSMSNIGFSQNGKEAYAGPGHWNDPDMLVVGMLGWGPKIRPTRLSRHEQVTHITLWSLLAAPLLIGCDLTQIDEFTLALLTNPEVLEVNQDPLGKQGRRVWAKDKLEVWSRALADGGTAVGLFNRTRRQATVTATWEMLGLHGRQQARNLWSRRDEGVFESQYSAAVPAHGAIMLKLAPAH